MTEGDVAHTAVVPDHDTMVAVLRLAQRAPSVHNTQPWRWVFDGSRLHLHTDPDRLLSAADPHGRQRIISCGANLHHLRTGFAAHGWHTDITRLPDPDRPDYLAMIAFRPWPDPPAGIPARARAMEQRRTDRLPMLPPHGWAEVLASVRRLVSPHDVALDVLDDSARARLAAVSEHTAAARKDDPMYQTELYWWAGHPDTTEGIPPTGLVSDAEFARVDVGRVYPSAPHSMRRGELTDHSTLVALSTEGDSVSQWLHTGEALSVVLLECTAAGLTTCALTHVTELPAARRTIAELVDTRTTPQVLIRIGAAPAEETPLPSTPRRPVEEIFTIDSQ
ncbi:Acg family FMN-binding oxidoreductase [Nocardia sp. CA-135398]|uniref:Acg family FMN-binding oxidoreductase n=1 Tax=Nocardia sp. CA-135398 TaxID=3239977 RepID=UPI003D95B9BB